MAYVCFFENHQPRSTMPLSSHTRRRPHKYAVPVTAHIVETATTMGSKEFEGACDFCEHCISIAQVGGCTNGTPRMCRRSERRKNQKRIQSPSDLARLCITTGVF